VRDSLKELKGPAVAIKQKLVTLSRVQGHKRQAAAAKPGAKQVDFNRFPAQEDDGLSPIDLHGIPGIPGQGDHAAASFPFSDSIKK
jgi:hypothetical protein